jgi:putative Holliday junction resolvase
VRYLCIDLGDKRTGLAAGDSQTRMVIPVDVLEVPVATQNGELLLSAIARAVLEHLGERRTGGGGGGGELVIGLPLNMDGTEGPRAKSVRALAQRIAERTGRTVHFHDERLSTAAADWTMARSGLTRGQKKAKRDALAAAAILRGFLDAAHPAPGAADPGWFREGAGADEPG